jgi:hypothetical protein
MAIELAQQERLQRIAKACRRKSGARRAAPRSVFQQSITIPAG